MNKLQLIFFLVPLIAAVNPGGTATLDIGVIEQAKDAYYNVLMQLLANLDVPDVDFDGGYLRQNSFYIKEAVQDMRISADQDLNGIRFEFNNLEAEFQSKDFHASYGIIQTSGSMSIDIKQVYIAFTEQTDMTTLPNGRVVPALVSVHIVTQIPTDMDHFKVHFEGDFAAEVINLLAPLFAGAIRDQIAAALNDQIGTALPVYLNQIIADQQGASELYQGLMLDWAVINQPRVFNTGLKFDIKGLFYKKGDAEVEPELQPPVMPYHDDSSPAKFQAFVSNYSLNSLAESFVEVYDTVLKMPAEVATLSKCLSLSQFSSNDIGSWTFNVTKLGDIDVRENTSTLRIAGDVEATAYIDGIKVLDIELEKALFNFTINVNDTELTGNVTEITVQGFRVITALGPWQFDTIAKLLSEVAKQAIVPLN